MMDMQKCDLLEEVSIEIERFKAAFSNAKNIYENENHELNHYGNGNGRANGAMKRASLDLSAALVKLRRDF